MDGCYHVRISDLKKGGKQRLDFRGPGRVNYSQVLTTRHFPKLLQSTIYFVLFPNFSGNILHTCPYKARSSTLEQELDTVALES